MSTPARIPELSVTKHFQLRMACKVADESERGSTGILGAFWTFFISVTGIKFPIWTEDKICPAYRAMQSGLPGLYKEALNRLLLMNPFISDLLSDSYKRKTIYLIIGKFPLSGFKAFFFLVVVMLCLIFKTAELWSLRRSKGNRLFISSNIQSFQLTLSLGIFMNKLIKISHAWRKQ